MHLARYIDHTILKPTTTKAEVDKVCDEALSYRFAAVCIPPPFVAHTASRLRDSGIHVATVVGFPFGYAATEAKMAETERALREGAQEIDMVINLVAMKGNDWQAITREVQGLVQTVHGASQTIKVIIETGVLTDKEIIQCCKTMGALGIDYLKTSTGYAEKGASVDAVQLMRNHLPSGVKIKASGGIRTYDFAKALVDAGADRLGCSASVAIVTGEPGFGTGY